MTVPRTLRTFGELTRLFAEMKVPHRVDADQQTLDAGPLRLHWENNHPFLHVTQPIRTNIPEDRVAAVEHAIVQHNHDAKVPVLDFDAATRTISFRITAFVLVDGVRLDLLQALLAGIDVRVRALQVELGRLLE